MNAPIPNLNLFHVLIANHNRDMTQEHTLDANIRAVRMGWLPSYPQFNISSLEIVRKAEQAGAKSDAEIRQWVVEQLKSGELKFAVQDPDAPENWPRLWFIWRGNALNASAKGQEYFFKHYLGTHNQIISDEVDKSHFNEVTYRDEAPEGKFDLVVDINFRMDTSALYSDIVLPTASWYEKDDLNTTDMHSFIHPLQLAVPPSWESKIDWDIFKILAGKISELAQTHMPEPVRDLVAMPLQHDTPAEMAQAHIRDWARGECEPIPGVTMPNFVVTERDYVNLGKRFISFGPKVQKEGLRHSWHSHWNLMTCIRNCWIANRRRHGTVRPILRWMLRETQQISSCIWRPRRMGKWHTAPSKPKKNAWARN